MNAFSHINHDLKLGFIIIFLEDCLIFIINIILITISSFTNIICKNRYISFPKDRCLMISTKPTILVGRFLVTNVSDFKRSIRL